MTKTKVNPLITRPAPQGQALAKELRDIGFNAISHPLFDYQQVGDRQTLSKLQQQLSQPILIFISVPAVNFAEALLPIKSWQTKNCIAVGTSTAKALEKLGINAIVPERQDSEGVLALEPLAKVNGQDILIFKGDGGRELIADTLVERGAKVNLFDCYQRVWKEIPQTDFSSWHQAKINCIVVTSQAMLEHMLKEIERHKQTELKNTTWLVASERIKQRAQQLGLTQVINIQSASNHTIISAITELELSYDRQKQS